MSKQMEPAEMRQTTPIQMDVPLTHESVQVRKTPPLPGRCRRPRSQIGCATKDALGGFQPKAFLHCHGVSQQDRPAHRPQFFDPRFGKTVNRVLSYPRRRSPKFL
jgi:hypothetical protein